MKRNMIKGMLIGVFIILVSIMAMYLGLVYYYKEGFSYGTWINGVYCTGKSINEVNDELLKDCHYEGLTVTDRNGKSYTILPEDVCLTFDFKDALSGYRQSQNEYLWIDNLLGGAGEKQIEPSVTYDRELFLQVIEDIFAGHGRKREEDRVIQIQKGEEGYFLLNERVHVLDEEKAKAALLEAFEGFRTELDLEAAGCYKDLPVTYEMQEQLRLWEKLKDYQECRIIYQFGEEQVPIDGSIVSNWLILDENGSPVLDEQGNLCTDEKKVDQFVDALADEYDTVGKARNFHATRGDIVTVEGGIYGNEIDRKAEKEYLFAAFLEKRNEIHVPFYKQMARKQGKDDIGDTYIEVDMTNQMMYYYKDGELTIETPVVTGNTSLRRGTPTGTNYVYNKQKNRVLRGADYASQVKFWIPVKGAIGIHDASWRGKYGGEIYKTNGSHGCINTPLEEVTKLYDMVEIGTPCVMFY